MLNLISIIIPIFNAEKSIKNCVQSLQNQTYSQLEIILVDDGSTDQSGIIIDNLATSDSRIKVIHQNNKGAGAARNQGLKYIHGDWVAFIDSDDTVEKDYIEKLLPDCNEDVQMTLCGMTRVYPNGKKVIWRLYTQLSEYKESYNLPIHTLMTDINPYALTGPVCKLLKASIIREHHLYFPLEMKLGEDSFFVYSYLYYVKKVKVVNLWLYNYSFNENSLSQNANSYDKILVAKRVYELSKRICEKNKINNLDTIQYHYIDGLMQVISSEKDWETRISCYQSIGALSRTNSVKKIMPFYFPFFAKIKLWRVYEWLTNSIYHNLI